VSPSEHAIASRDEHVNAGLLAVGDVEGLCGDDSVLDMLKAVGAYGFVVHGETSPGNRLDLDAGFARSALGAFDAPAI
jgi:hypothetical protein